VPHGGCVFNSVRSSSASGFRMSEAPFIPASMVKTTVFTGENGKHRGRIWLKDLNKTAGYQAWPESYKLETAVKLLEKGALAWYEGVQDKIESWADFEREFKELFVADDEATKEDKYEEMLEYTHKDQSTTEYVLTKKGLCEQCSLSVQKTKEKILEKLKDRDLVNILMAKDHTTTAAIYKHVVDYEELKAKRLANRNAIRNQSNLQVQHFQRKNSENAGNDVRQSSNSTMTQSTHQGNRFRETTASEATFVCFKCNQVGHRAAKCPNPSYCPACKVQGHSKRECRKENAREAGTTNSQASIQAPTGSQANQNTSQNRNQTTFKKPGQSSTNQILDSQRNTDEVHIKDVFIAESDVPLEGFVDTGSTVCIMKLSTAAMKKLPIIYESREVRSYGGTPIPTIGTVTTDITIDGVLATGVEFTVVLDQQQQWPMLIGRTYTELPHLGYHRDLNFEFYYRKNSPYFGNTEPFIKKKPPKIFLTASKQVVVPAKSVQWLSVDCPDQKARMIEVRRPSEVGRLFSVENQKTRIPIENNSEEDRTIKANEVVCGGRVRTEEDLVEEEQGG
jgi:hypothetical protein